jgi:nucleotide-binding universal stress UspA family protein
MFETIVWATDGSETANRALPIVTGLALRHRSKIVAVHATEVLGRRLADDPDLILEIERQVEELRAAGFVAELRVPRGMESVAGLIARAAEDVGAALIVIGTRGHGGVASALLGSVTRGLLHEASCPVLALPPERRTARQAA